MSIVGIFVLRADAPYLFDGLTSRALPFVVIAGVAGAASSWALLRASPTGARILAMAAVASVILAWGVAQWDYMLPESLTISQAAAPSGTIVAVLVAVGLAAVLVLPGFVLLYVLDQRGSLPEEGVG